MRIDVLRPSELTAGQRADWRAIQAGDPALGSPFLAPEWPLACEVAGDRHVRVAVAAADGEAAAFLAVRRGPFTAMAPGAPLCDAQAVLAAPGVRVEAAALLRALGVSRFDFTHAPAGDPVLGPGARGRTENHYVDLSQGWATYERELKARKSDLLRDVRQRTNRAAREAGPVCFTLDDPDPAAFAQMLAWKQEQYRETRQTDVVRPAWARRLLEQLFQTREPGFGARLSTLRIDDRLAAAHLGLYAGEVFYAWFIAHDCQQSRHSPGMVIMTEITRALAEEGRFRAFELGPGEYPFKQRMCNANRPLAFGFIGRPSAAVLLREAEYRVRRWAEAAPLGRASAWPGKAMRRWDVIRALG